MEWCFCDILDILFIKQEKFKVETTSGPMMTVGLELHTCTYSVKATPVYVLQSGKSGGRHPLAWTPTAVFRMLTFSFYILHTLSQAIPHKSSETSVDYWNQRSLFWIIDAVILFPSRLIFFFFFCHARWYRHRIQPLISFFPLTSHKLSAGCGIWKSNTPSTLKKVKF